MKKQFFAIGTAIAMSAALFAFAACEETPEQNGDDSQGGNQPSANAFRMAGDLQELYGGENGYPQAVLVAKTSVLETAGAAVETITSYMEGSAEYLAQASAQTVVDLLADYYTEGMTPSLNAKNLTAEVIANCSVEYYSAADKATQTRVNNYLAELIAVDSTAAKAVSDAFYYVPAASDEGAATSDVTYTVYAPDGAPALALANAVSQSQESTLFDFHIVASETIGAQVSGETPAADFCILPVNAASKRLGTGEKYKMLGIVTNGNIFLLTTGDNAVITPENLSSLVGKTVGVVQLPNVPGLTFRAVLDKYDIAYQVLGNDNAPAADKVNLKAMDATNVTPAGGCDYYLCPEPAATTKINATAGK